VKCEPKWSEVNLCGAGASSAKNNLHRPMNADPRQRRLILRSTRCALLATSVVFLTTTLMAQQTRKPDDPEHPCVNAMTQMELNQCAGEQYHKADARLNTIYRRLLETMQKDLADARDRKDSDLIKYSEQGIEKLRAAENAWIQYRDLHCEAARHQYEGGSMSPMIWGFCMAETTLDRIRELKSAYEEGDRKLE